MDVTLKTLSDSNLETLASLANNKSIWLNVRDVFPNPYTIYDAQSYYNFVKDNPQNVIKAIHYKGEFCGMIGLFPKNDVYKYSGELGYWLGEPFWGKGIATQALQLICIHAFEELGLERVYAGVFDYNKGSAKVLEKNGFQKEGVMRRAVFKNGEFCDEVIYGKIK